MQPGRSCRYPPPLPSFFFTLCETDRDEHQGPNANDMAGPGCQKWRMVSDARSQRPQPAVCGRLLLDVSTRLAGGWNARLPTSCLDLHSTLVGGKLHSLCRRANGLRCPNSKQKLVRKRARGTSQKEKICIAGSDRRVQVFSFHPAYTLFLAVMSMFARFARFRHALPCHEKRRGKNATDL